MKITDRKTIIENKGLTLIEMLVTLAILGILAAIAIPAYTGYERGGARQEATTNLQGLSVCLQQYYADNAQYSKTGDTTPITYTWVSPTNNGLSWLTCFNPQAAAGQTNNYKYQLQVPDPGGAANSFLATAIPVSGPVAGDSNMTINDTGVKNGPWPQ